MFLEGARKKYKFVGMIFKLLRKLHIYGAYHRILEGLMKLSCPQFTICNFSGYGDNFKEYFIKHNMPKVIESLKQGLDEVSKQVVDANVERFLNLPLRSSKYSKNGMYSAFSFADSISTPLQIAESKAYYNTLSKLNKKYPGEFSFRILDAPRKDSESFYYHHGLKFLDERVLKYMKGKEFLDCGACFGDSSVVFNEYSPSKVYAFEMNLACKKLYYQNLALNGIDAEKFVFINKGISNTNSKIQISKKDYAAMTMQREADVKEEDCFAELVKIDDFCDGHKIGLIQMDIEGAEYNAILGAKETIKRDRPVISATIYHTPQQYFELKPLIESWQLGYTFIIRDLNPSVNCLETTLICVPKI